MNLNYTFYSILSHIDFMYVYLNGDTRYVNKRRLEVLLSRTIQTFANKPFALLPVFMLS